MNFTLNAEPRGPQSTKWLKNNGYIPGCVYGKGVDSFNIQVPVSAFRKCLNSGSKKFELTVKGEGTWTVGIEEIQKTPTGDFYNHISLHALQNDEKATLDVPIEFTGEAKGQIDGGQLTPLLSHLTVKGYPKDLPDKITIDVSKIDIGELIHVSDIASQYNFEFLQEDFDKALVKCEHAKVLYIEEIQAVKEAPEETTESISAETTSYEEKKAA